MVYVVLLVVYEYYRLDLIPGEIKAHPTDFREVVSALPIVVFAYQTHVNLVPIYSSLRDRCLMNLMKSTALAMALLFILYVIIGSFGYLTFGGKAVSDVMKAYDPSDPIVALGVFAVLIKVIATYPQMIFCGRQSFDSFLSSGKSIFKLSSNMKYFKTSKTIPKSLDQCDQGICRRFVTSGIINLLILFLALITPNLNKLLQWLGSISSITSLVFPGICMATLATSQTATILWSRMSCIIMFIIGILVIFIGIAIFLLIFLNFSIISKEDSLDILCQY